MSSAPTGGPRILKGLFMWVPLGVVAIVLIGYVVQRLPDRIPKMADSLFAAATGEADIKGIRTSNNSIRPASETGNGLAEPMRGPTRGNPLPSLSKEGSGALEASGAPSLTMPVAPVFSAKESEALKELKGLDPTSEQANAIRTELLNKLVRDFTTNQEMQRKEVEHLKRVVAMWETSLGYRDENRREIVERQLAEQLGIPDPTTWRFEGKSMLAPTVPVDILHRSKSLLDAYWASVEANGVAEITAKDVTTTDAGSAGTSSGATTGSTVVSVPDSGEPPAVGGAARGSSLPSAAPASPVESYQIVPKRSPENIFPAEPAPVEAPAPKPAGDAGGGA